MRAFKRILIPTDFSPAAWQAIQYGLSTCLKEVSEIVLLHIFPSNAKYSTKRNLPEPEDMQNMAEIEKEMDQLCESLASDSDITFTPKVVRGNVNQEILSIINDGQFDLVVMGVNSNGQNNEIGSHVSQVIQQSNLPVLVVPNTKAAQLVSKKSA